MEDQDEGFVPTPAPVTDWMVSVLFAESPNAGDKVLLPGSGTGNFAAAIQRCCSYRGHSCPEIHAIESNQDRAETFTNRFEGANKPQRPAIPDASAQQLEYTYPPDWTPSYSDIQMDITLQHDDFLLTSPREQFDYIISNPPFVQYNHLDEDKRERYSKRFNTAVGRFNLYAPFVEQMLDHLTESGHLICILPEDFLLSTNSDFRNRLREETIHYLRPLPEPVFSDHMVRTCMVDISADTSLGLNSSFVVDTWSYKPEIEAILRGVGVDEEKLEDYTEKYLGRVRRLQESLRARRRTAGREEGYDTPGRAQMGGETQADLGNWA